MPSGSRPGRAARSRISARKAVHAVWPGADSTGCPTFDRVTGEPARRYERPGELIHVDVTRFGNIPDGGGGGSSAPSNAGRTDKQPSIAPERNQAL